MTSPKIIVEGIPSADEFDAGLTAAGVAEGQHIVDAVAAYLARNAEGTFDPRRGGVNYSERALAAANRALAPLRWKVAEERTDDGGRFECVYNLERVSATGRVDVSRVPLTWGAPSPCDNAAQRVIDKVAAHVGHFSCTTDMVYRGLPLPFGADEAPTKETIDAANDALAETPWHIVAGLGPHGRLDEPRETVYRVALRPVAAGRFKVTKPADTDATSTPEVTAARVDTSRVPHKLGEPVRVSPVQRVVDQLVAYLEPVSGRGPLELFDESGAPPSTETIAAANVALATTPWRIDIVPGNGGAPCYALFPRAVGPR